MLDYIIVQAGGKGTRMGALTKNKPKALVPINNLPMIFHLFRKYHNKKFIIIGDYKYDVLEKYLREFADVDYNLVCASGHTGTCAGLSDAVSFIPQNESFMLIWCDLILADDDKLPEIKENILGISKGFPCRWRYENHVFAEECSSECGVAGYFIFKDKSYLKGVPEEGEFVRWLKDKKYTFHVHPLLKTHEYGLYSEWSRLPKIKCRPFNELKIEGDRVYKRGIDAQGVRLSEREAAWYQKLKYLAIENLPAVYTYAPLCMERINGKNIYEYSSISDVEKRKILRDIIHCLKDIHHLENVPAERDSYYDAYLGKTYERLKKVRYLVPFAQDEIVTINGRVCRNIFYHQTEVEGMIMQYMPDRFPLIHGDCTFSNIMLREDHTPVFIDPRGYFGNTEFYGDAAYDWVKIYYSLISNYDQFNLKRFTLDITEDGVWLEIASNGWEKLEDEFFEILKDEVTRSQMKLFLAMTWLSLTTYAWEDYDSICGAFYMGLYYLEEAFEMESAFSYFEKNISLIEDALKTVSMPQMERLLLECEETLRDGYKIIASGLGKNVPICDKFVGTMLSLGLNAGFLHTNSAVHGDMGMVKQGDLVIILTKSGSTMESVYLADLLKKREGVRLWLLSFSQHSELADTFEKKIIIDLKHEGDLWDIVPNNSTTLNLIVLQTIAIELAKRLDLTLDKNFRPNHPGGAIGCKLKHQEEKRNVPEL